jgi:hypothetical protein
MAGLGKFQIQLGDSATATQNFVLTSAAADGTMKLARGNYGATTQDIMTVSNSGVVSFPQGGVMPAGAIIDFAGTTAPAGFLACPTVATNISRSTYSDLFLAIGTTWGAGDGSTTFGMPYFPADYAAVQANANVGTNSVGAVISHTHTLNNTANIGGGGAAPNMLGSGSAVVTTNATGGAANLAAGVRVLKCVKY